VFKSVEAEARFSPEALGGFQRCGQFGYSNRYAHAGKSEADKPIRPEGEKFCSLSFMPKRIIHQAPTVMAKALADYMKGEMTVEDIAELRGISTATLTVWAKKAGLTLRPRGRRKQEVPTKHQLEIIRLASVYKYDEVGLRFGMHKQSIHRIVKRWRDWAQPKKAPFEPGDMLSWRGKKFTVIDANQHDGTLIDEKGTVWKNFAWNGGRVPKKIGVNPRYVVSAQPAAAAA
jgi:transposase